MKRLILSVFILFPVCAFAQIWEETFNGLTVGMIEDNGATAWTTQQPAGSGAVFSKQSYPGYEIIAVNNTLDEGTWISEEIDISSAEEVAIEITWGSYWASSTDYLRAYYKVDGGNETLFGEETGKPNLQIASAASAIVSGSTLQIIIKGKENTAGTYGSYPRMMGIDDVTVSELTYLYSRQSGNWDNTNTWSISGYSGASCFCTPNENTHVFVGNSRTVNLNSSVESAGVTIEASGRINYTANAQLNIVRGGVLKIASNSTLDRNGNTASLSFSTYNYNINIDGDLSIDNMIIDAANATFSGVGSMNISGDLSVNNVVSKSIITDLSGSLTVGDDINFNSSSNNFTFSNTGNISVNDRILFNTTNTTFSNSGTLNIGSGGIVMNDNADDGNIFTNSGDLSLSSVNLNNADFTFNNYGSITQTGDFSNVSSGSSFHNRSGGEWNYGGTGFISRLFASEAGNIFNYNGSGNQNVAVPVDGAYHQLSLSGSGTKTTQGDLTLNADLVISGSASLDMSVSSFELLVGGNWTVTSSGSDPFVERSSSITFNGANNQSISSALSEEVFSQLTIDNSGGNVILNSSPGTNLSVSALTLTNGALELNGNAIDVLGSSALAISRTNGYIISETSASPYSRVNWSVGQETGAYVFPFGNRAGDFIPFTFDITSAGKGSGIVSIGTYSTASDNRPYPFGVLNLNSSDGSDNSANVVDRFWQIDLTGYINEPISYVTFTAAPSEVGSNSNLKAQRWNSFESKWDEPLTGQINPDLYSVEVPNVSQFSPWTLSDAANPLPVQLVDFSANVINGGVILQWSTFQEVGNDYFTVEKTKDFKTFFETGKVGGSGNSNQGNHYQLIDSHPFSGLFYYRLKQTDFDGTTEVFKPVSVVWEEGLTNSIVYPNPTNGDRIFIKLPVQFRNESTPVTLYNAQGQQVYESIKNYSNEVEITFERPLSEGIHFVKIGDSFIDKFIVK